MSVRPSQAAAAEAAAEAAAAATEAAKTEMAEPEGGEAVTDILFKHLREAYGLDPACESHGTVPPESVRARLRDSIGDDGTVDFAALFASGSSGKDTVRWCRLKVSEPVLKSPVVSAHETVIPYIIFNCCFQFQLAPLQHGEEGVKEGQKRQKGQKGQRQAEGRGGGRLRAGGEAGDSGGERGLGGGSSQGRLGFRLGGAGAAARPGVLHLQPRRVPGRRQPLRHGSGPDDLPLQYPNAPIE